MADMVQLGRLDCSDGLARFNELYEQLELYLHRLLDCEPRSRDRTPGAKHVAVPHAPGVYLFTDNGSHRYIGRAKDLNHRFGQHVAAGSRHNQAAFAFNIAKRVAEQTGFPLASLNREELGVDPEFNDRFFTSAKDRVCSMEFRFVLFDPAMRSADALSTIFEVYASMLLGTEGDFNLFATH